MFETPSRRLFSTPDALASGDYVCRRLNVPRDTQWLSLVNGALSLLMREYNYEVNADGISIEDTTAIFRQMFLDYTESEEFCMIGVVVPTAIAVDEMPSNLLLCDGATYARVDYPILYARLDIIYHIDSDNFNVPYLPGRVPIGTSDDYPMGSTGGEVEHTLTVAEMPIHNHSDVPHAHSEIIAVPSLTTPGELPIPVASAVPGAGVTGGASVTILDTGGGFAHNNMQPYTPLRYAIIAL